MKKLNFKQILEGWKNDLFPSKELKTVIRDTQAERLSICRTCEFNSTPNSITPFTTCKDCGCPLKKKTACLSCMCPQEKWEALLTPEEDIKIKDLLKQQIDEEKL